MSKLTITQSSSIEITGEVQKPFIFIPYEWQGEMDSAFVSTEEGELKLQGVPLRKIISYSQPVKENSKITIYSTTADAYHLTDGEQLAMDDDIQVFLKTTDAGIEFILGKLNGEVILREIDRVEID